MKPHAIKLSTLEVQILGGCLGDVICAWKPNVTDSYEDAKLALALRLLREFEDSAPHRLTDALENPVVIELLEAGRRAARELPPLKQRLEQATAEVRALKANRAQRTAHPHTKKHATGTASAPHASSTTSGKAPAAVRSGTAAAKPAPSAAAGAGPARPTTSTETRSSSSAGAATAGAAPSRTLTTDPAPIALSDGEAAALRHAAARGA